MAEDNATNPGADDDLSPIVEVDENEGAEAELPDGEGQDGDDGDQAPGPDEETEDFEHDGKVYALPKSLKPLLLMQADYTRKTQEVGAKRTELDDGFRALAQQTETQQALIEEMAEAKTVDKVLGEYKKITQAQWNQYFTDSPEQAAADWRNFELLKGQKAELDTKIADKRKTVLDGQQVQSAKAIEQGVAVLEKEIPGFSPAHFNELITLAAKYDVKPQEMQRQLADPRTIRIVNALYEAEKKLKTLQTTRRVQTTAAVRPAAQVRGAASPSSVGPNGPKDPDAWRVWRNQQVTAKNKRK